LHAGPVGEQRVEADPVGATPQTLAPPPGHLDQSTPDQLGERRPVLVGGICNLGPPGRDRADVVRARRPAVCEQDRVDRGLDIGAAFSGEQVGQFLLRLAERVEQVVSAEAEVGARRLMFLLMEPPGHEPRRRAVHLLAGIAPSTLLIEPSLKLGPFQCVAPHGRAKLDRAERAPDLVALEEISKVSRDAASQIPPRLAADQTRVASHVVHPAMCNSGVVNESSKPASGLDFPRT
jgi:hypothetical protein